MKTIKRISALLLAVLLMAGLSISAWAESYDLGQGNITVTATSEGGTTTQTVTQGENTSTDANPKIYSETVTGNTLTIKAEDANAEASVTLNGVFIESYSAPVITSGEGSVVIELDGTNTVTAGSSHAGVEKRNSGSLTIKDDNENPGSLTAQGGRYGAGIGGGACGVGTNITISGGTVTAQGGLFGAGIGGGWQGDGTAITITDATVYAAGCESGAGIGGGADGAGSTITISGDAQVHVAAGQETIDGIGSFGAGAAIGNGGGWNVDVAEVDPDTSGLSESGSIIIYIPGTSAEKMKQGPVPEPAPKPEPKPEPVIGQEPEDDTPPVGKPAAPTTCKLSFELGGGTIDGKSTYTRNMLFGQKLELPTPVKDGATFKGWKTTIGREEVILEAGTLFTVKGPASFTAIWE